MPTGKIKFFNEEKNFGFIEREDASDIYFNKKQWFGPGTPQVEQEVTFDVGQYRGKTEAQNVRPINTEVQKTKPTTSISRQASDTEYRFLNPYNFVRFLDRPDPEPKDDAAPEQKLLWHCPPPPHDRYVGLTGRITCEITAETPLFISDSHGIEDDKGHKTYRFFEYEGQPAIPASSLRGMTRSVFEMVTNSCFAHFDYESRLSYHLKASEASKLVPARVECTDDGNWQLRLLPGQTQINVDQRPDSLYAARVEQYDPLQPTRPKKRKGQPSPRLKTPKPVSLNGLKHGEKCYALAYKRKFPQVYEVIKLSRDRNTLTAQGDQEILEGYLCLNNQNIENKRYERFFFWRSNSGQKEIVIQLPDLVRTRYAELIHDYQLRHANTIKTWREQGDQPDQPRIRQRNGRRVKDSAFSRFIINGSPSAKDGDLVYVKLTKKDEASYEVAYIVPVAIPRIGYDRKVYELLLEHLQKCASVKTLCPACRTFGWVAADKANGQQAYAGRLRFTHGKTQEGDYQPFDKSIPLAILSSPKPTTTLFYLLKNGQPDDYVDYNDDNAQLRGRKVYRHHGDQLRKEEYTRLLSSEQNRTVRGALKPGAKFTFTIDFENLANVELGALLWALELEEGMYHRLGYAKPLGFGSVKLKVNQLKIINPDERYKSLISWDDGWLPVSKAKFSIWKEAFKRAMEDLYHQSFDQLNPIQDLRALLGEPRDSSLPIHYPRPDPKLSGDGKEENFRWFGDNKEPLQLAPDDKGFTIPPRGRKK